MTLTATGTTLGALTSPISEEPFRRAANISRYRHMPNSNADNRQGWYVQLGYFLNQVPMTFAPEVIQDSPIG